ncbi:MAG: YjbF family lipoprotein [Alphaproteobacteria bacterium]|nr:YjbF family lipoprotein [Alphaproteobacteria bacterium]
MARSLNTSTNSSSRRVRRAAPLIVAVCALAGCSTIGGGDVASLYAITKSIWSDGGRVTLEQAAAVPYASMGVRLGDSPEAMIILAGDAGGQRLWTSAAGVAIMTNDGRIVRTSGFEHNLGGYESRVGAPGENGVQVVRWQADFTDLNLYSVLITCRDRPVGDETIVILGKSIRTRHVVESCASDASRLDWSFENTYWTDPVSGLVWRSIQHVHPQLDAIETEILRPPA